MEQNPEMEPHIYGQLIFDKGTRNMRKEKSLFNTILLGKLDIQVQKKKLKLEFHLISYAKINSSYLGSKSWFLKGKIFFCLFKVASIEDECSLNLLWSSLYDLCN